jgi:hypothetical protein
VSGFPGQHGYGEFMAAQRDRDREAARQDVPPVERSVEMHDITDSLRLKIDTLSRTKVDKLTTRDLDKIIRILEGSLEYIKALHKLNDTYAVCIAAYQGRDNDRLKG